MKLSRWNRQRRPEVETHMDYQTITLVWLALVASMQAHAVTVHTWTDENGVVHYGDRVPDSVDNAETLELEDLPPPDDADPYSVVKQWERVREERERKDALALERERLRAEERASRAAPPPVVTPSWRPVIYPGFNPYRNRGAGFGRGFNGGPQPSGRDAYNDQRRRRGFSPEGVPAWPNR